MTDSQKVETATTAASSEDQQAEAVEERNCYRQNSLAAQNLQKKRAVGEYRLESCLKMDAGYLEKRGKGFQMRSRY